MSVRISIRMSGLIAFIRAVIAMVCALTAIMRAVIAMVCALLEIIPARIATIAMRCSYI
jgi:hypothetical protein